MKKEAIDVLVQPKERLSVFKPHGGEQAQR